MLGHEEGMGTEYAIHQAFPAKRATSASMLMRLLGSLWYRVSCVSDFAYLVWPAVVL